MLPPGTVRLPDILLPPGTDRLPAILLPPGTDSLPGIAKLPAGALNPDPVLFGNANERFSKKMQLF